MPDDPVSPPARRRFLRRLALGAGAASTGVLLAGCGGEGGSAGPSADSASTADGGGANQCVPPGELSEEARQGRQQYDYVAESPRPQQQCDNCQFWQPEGAPEQADDACGGCQLFAGPVHAEGFCSAWLTA